MLISLRTGMSTWRHPKAFGLLAPAPATCIPRPQLSTCIASCESGHLFPQSSTLGMRHSPQNTFRPHAGSPHAAADARCLLQPWRHMHINAALRGHARGPASAHCIARKRKRHRRAGREIHCPCCCARLVDANAFGAPAGRMQHETCAIASEGPCGSCSVLKIGIPMPRGSVIVMESSSGKTL